jgi:hypothetical protein
MGRLDPVPNQRRKAILDGKFPIVADFATKKLTRCLPHAESAWPNLRSPSINLQYRYLGHMHRATVQV